MMGFTAVARHRRKDVTLFRKNDINFLVNATPYTHFQQFAHAHGPSACAMGWRVADGPAAHAHALAQGAVAFDTKPGLMELNLPAVYGIGNSVLYLVDRYGAEHSIYDRSEEHTSELQSLMRISYAVFCLKKKKKT